MENIFNGKWYWRVFVKTEHGPESICKEAYIYRTFGMRIGDFIVNTLRKVFRFKAV